MSLDQVFERVTIPVLLAYESPAVQGYSRDCAEFRAAFEAEMRDGWARFSRQCSSRPLPVGVRLFFAPLESKQALVSELDRRLPGWCLTAAEIRDLITGPPEAFGDSAFAVLSGVAALSSRGAQAESRDLLLRLLDRRDVLGAGGPLLDALIREHGLFPYLDDPESLGMADRLAYESAPAPGNRRPRVPRQAGRGLPAARGRPQRRAQRAYELREVPDHRRDPRYRQVPDHGPHRADGRADRRDPAPAHPPVPRRSTRSSPSPRSRPASGRCTS